MTKKKSADAPLFGNAAPQSKPAETVAAKREPRSAPARRTEVAKVERLPAPVPENLLSTLFSAIVDPRIDVEKLRGLVDVRDRLMREQARVEFMTAYAGMRSELPRITRDGKLDQGTTRSGRQGVTARYASFENIHDSVAPILAKHKMNVLALPDVPADGTGIIIRGQISYVCETQYGKFVHSENCTIPLPPDNTGGKSPPQGIGSTVKYGMRYAYITLLGIVSHAPEDADNLDSKPRGRKPADGELVTAEQLKTLKAAIEFCGVSDPDFCKFYKLDKVEDLPAKMLDEALQACRDFAESHPDKAKKNA